MTESAAAPSYAPAKRLATVPVKTVWHEFTPMAMEYKAVMLGQGFPSFPPPPFVTEALTAATNSSDYFAHQYCRASGHLSLVNVLIERYSPRIGRALSVNEIIVTNGTTQALNLITMGLLNEGDEAIIIEPFFDLYQNDVEMSGAKCVVVGMRDDPDFANGWKVNMEELKAAINPRTKIMMLNTPQNVPGKVWSRAEMEEIADLAKKHNFLVVSDEVYEELALDGEHINMASLPGMYERTLTCASVGKSLSCTGWKMGWCIAPAPLIQALSQVHAHQCFSVATPLQIAAAASLQTMAATNYGLELRATYRRRRDVLVNGLRSAGLRPVVPQGSFFVLADITAIDESYYMDPAVTDVAKDWQFCRWLTKHIGVGAIPCTAFCRKTSWPQFEKYIRFAFCKTDEAIEEGCSRLQKLTAYHKK
jgi:kynurenine--oxoglutarate transaminase/cysteine-S-conjugate beta-lyase/glutamine--phenylpyruvate transaminase